ncbi:hypothetical protein RDWZM_006142 [Blomia tropicalis]|uniref:EF-hand domain-containing protein n=1 Tax=Blomia tropicalis TaxID=40697 RepID=A0A9Q0RN97_BLOTA|nr:hypothetical protein RDWZM_006142 [Blomia tropicalis]
MLGVVRNEILTVYHRFRELDPKLVPTVMTGQQPSTIIMPMEKITKMPELKENPFKERICKVFSHDGSGNMTFDDFLDMLSVFSEQASRSVKLHYAFRIYDFNGDSLITEEDIEQVVIALTRNELSQDEIKIVCEKVLEEADMDDDKAISQTEFQHVISRAPEFIK